MTTPPPSAPGEGATAVTARLQLLADVLRGEMRLSDVLQRAGSLGLGWSATMVLIRALERAKSHNAAKEAADD